MTPEELERLRQLHEQLPPAPWQEPGNPENPDMPELVTDRDGCIIAEGTGQWEEYLSCLATPAPVLLMELRNALPVLLSEIDRLTQGQKTAKAEGWAEGRDAGWQEHYECYITNTRDPENPADIIPNPYEETAESRLGRINRDHPAMCEEALEGTHQ